MTTRFSEGVTLGNNRSLFLNSNQVIEDDNTGVLLAGRRSRLRNRGTIFGGVNGVDIQGQSASVLNTGAILSDSRAVNIGEDGANVINQFDIIGTGNQRNGTIYFDGNVDNARFTNRRNGIVDAGRGNLGDGISVQVGAASEDARSRSIRLVNDRSAFIAGRGQPGFADGMRTAANGSSGIRFFNGSGRSEAVLERSSITNSGSITSEANVGFLGGLVVEDGVAFRGQIRNRRTGRIFGPRNGLYIGNANHRLTISNEGRIESGSRVVNLDGDNVRFNNQGNVTGTGDQRNGTLYVDGTGDNIRINNLSRGVIDAGRGNSGSGVSIQVGAAGDSSTSVDLSNRGRIQGRGNSNVPAGVRLFVGSGLSQATFSGDLDNLRGGQIASERSAGILIEEGVVFDGEINNSGTIRGGNGFAVDAAGSLGSIDFDNRGTLVGEVRLGEGNDNFKQLSRQGVVVDGGGGNDSLRAGAGRDTFVFSENSGRDRISNFSTSRDRLDVSEVFDGNARQFLGSNRISQRGRDTLINLGDGNTVTLAGVRASQLSTRNFLT